MVAEDTYVYLMGPSGSGKSWLANNMVSFVIGEQPFVQGCGVGDPTSECSAWRSRHPGCSDLVIMDTPGIPDGYGNTEKYVDKINASLINTGCAVLFFVVPFTTRPPLPEQIQAFSTVRKYLRSRLSSRTYLVYNMVSLGKISHDYEGRPRNEEEMSQIITNVVYRVADALGFDRNRYITVPDMGNATMAGKDTSLVVGRSKAELQEFDWVVWARSDAAGLKAKEAARSMLKFSVSHKNVYLHDSITFKDVHERHKEAVKDAQKEEDDAVASYNACANNIGSVKGKVRAEKVELANLLNDVASGHAQVIEAGVNHVLEDGEDRRKRIDMLKVILNDTHRVIVKGGEEPRRKLRKVEDWIEEADEAKSKAETMDEGAGVYLAYGRYYDDKKRELKKRKDEYRKYTDAQDKVSNIRSWVESLPDLDQALKDVEAKLPDLRSALAAARNAEAALALHRCVRAEESTRL